MIAAAMAMWLGGCGGTTPGTGVIDGDVDGRAFDTVGATFWIGSPDDPQQTRVIYVFDAPVACEAIVDPAWDATLDETQVVEIKLIGTTPDTYPIAADGRPSAGEADANYTQTSTTSEPTEVSAQSGTVTIDDFRDGEAAVGSFELTFSGGSLAGNFAATDCPQGREP